MSRLSAMNLGSRRELFVDTHHDDDGSPCVCIGRGVPAIRISVAALFLLFTGCVAAWDTFGQVAGRPAQEAAPASVSTALPEGAWTVVGASQGSATLDVSGETEDTRGIDFKSDGTMLYVVGRRSANVAAYALEAPWNLTSATFVDTFEEIGRNLPGREAQGSVAHGLFLRKCDGRKMFVWNRTESFAYDLATPWDVTTAVPTGYQSFAGIVQRGHDIEFKPDGTRFYVDDRDAGAVYQFELATPWDITTADLAYTLDISDWQKQVRGIQFSPDGRRFFILDTVLSSITEFRLENAWDLDGAEKYATFDVQRSDPRAVTWRPDGRMFFVTERDGGVIHTYHAGEKED